MDNNEIRQVLRRKPKRELIDLIDIFQDSCPRFRKPPLYQKLNKEMLASKLGTSLLNLIARHPEDQEICFEILSGDTDEQGQKITSTKKATKKHPSLIKRIPFNPQKICDMFKKMVEEDEEFKAKWEKKREFLGFLEILAINEIGIPDEIGNVLYKRLFNQDQDISEDSVINFSRYQLDNWEEEFRKMMKHLEPIESDLVLSYNLILKELIRILEKENIEINYNYDDIPILKRIILAQYVRLIGKKCSDDILDDFADIASNIIEKTDTFIKLFPWSDFE